MRRQCENKYGQDKYKNTKHESNDILYKLTCMLLAKFVKFPTLQQAEFIKPT